ncbi:SET domain-containing protein SmydA-8-like [Galleria mellonella]|uniref:SET domain-containing protein SmydA-8-like n=1 Tax=Galleria mellonella TaxID=7137 RepID=A0ABM3N4K9_GALME|nr:SET domain-containing protein SmydA-8-like [Galleria mellonella]
MLSLEQLSQIVKEHLGLYMLIEGTQYTSKWIISESALGGRGIFATEDIMPGDVLFVDHPLIRGPRSGTTIQRGCTICNKLDGDEFFKCPKCGLLLCSEQCQNTNRHGDDCDIIGGWTKKVPTEEIDDTLLSRALTAIRSLLLNEEQKQLMLSLVAHMEPPHGSEITRLKKYFDFSDEDEQMMILACCALDANAFQIASPFGVKEMSTRGLYPVAALMNHSCVSNTRYTFNSDLQMTVKAVKPIRSGSEIFTCYSGILWGTPARRTYLYKTKHFLCKCERCADPTERGTLLAALKCFVTECPGSMLPVEPLKLSTRWRCLECGLFVPNKNICAVQGALGSLMGTLDFDNVNELEYFLLRRIIKFIPKTNQIVVDLQCRLIWELGESEGLRWHDKFRTYIGTVNTCHAYIFFNVYLL